MPSERFVQVNSARFEAFLQSLGFERSIHGKEVVYVRKHRNSKLSNLQVKVYTTISAILPNSNEDHTARDCGEDAIRVVAIYDDGKGKSFGVAKFPRVYRTASATLSDDEREQVVFTRTADRMRLAYGRLNDWAKNHPLWFR